MRGDARYVWSRMTGPRRLSARTLLCLAFGAALLDLSACSTVPQQRGPITGAQKAASPPPANRTGKGGYYQDDGPGDNPPPDLDQIPDAVPKAEPLNGAANRPYVVFGQEYVPATSFRPYREQGIASWYGRKFNGLKTSSGEVYDMYAMTAAHATLPIPSYARVTNLGNHKSVVVRINDRGPFLSNRLIDLSYTAAYKLGILQDGSALVEVDAIDPTHSEEPAPPTLRAERENTAPAADAAGVYLQLAAFSVRQNAEDFSSRMKQQLGTLGEVLHILSGDGLFRVNLGPYGSRSEAGEVAARVKQTVDIAPLVVVR